MKLTNQHQEAFEKFSKLKVGALFMEQGTGKTRVAIDLIHSTDCDFVLFLCPFSTKSNLLNEIEKWKLDRPFEIVGYETISSSDSKYLDLLSLCKEYEKIFVVADESVFIKNDSNRRYNRILKLRDLSEYRLILNGTPITKDEWDIYNQMNFLSPKIIGMQRNEFLRTFFKHVKYKKRGQPQREFYKLSKVNIGYLHRLIEPYIFEADLKFDKAETTKMINIQASNDAYEAYQSAKEQLLESLKFGECGVEMFVNLANICFRDVERHKQIAKYLFGKTIVFCTLLEEVKNIADQIDCYVITGETKNRGEIIEQFKNDNKPLLMTFGTGAFGLNLQFCNRVAFSSLTYDYAKIEQAKARIRRIGQTRDIEYIYFTSDLGIFNMIQENVSKKMRLEELIIKKIKEGEIDEYI